MVKLLVKHCFSSAKVNTFLAPMPSDPMAKAQWWVLIFDLGSVVHI